MLFIWFRSSDPAFSFFFCKFFKNHVLDTFFTPFTFFTFLMRSSSDLLSFTITVRFPWNNPAFVSMEMERSITSFSLEIMDVMLVTIPISSCPTTRSVIGYCDPSDLPDHLALIIRYPNRDIFCWAFGHFVLWIFIQTFTDTNPKISYQ